jgi:hypothetical protein
VRRVNGVLWFSRWFAERLQKRAKSSQERRYPGGYVFAFIEGDGLDFDYGIDYIECASCKFLNEQDAPELIPYVCAVDKVATFMLFGRLDRGDCYLFIDGVQLTDHIWNYTRGLRHANITVK